jgi:6-phospho-3-hexuloisomerase
MTKTHADLSQTITAEIAAAVAAVDSDAVQAAAHAIQTADRIFVFGEGRSGLALRMGAMRIVHLGKTAHIVGDATTPAISAGDLLIVGSGSGTTPVTVLIAEQAKSTGVRLLTITANPDSRLASLADIVLALRTPSKGGSSDGASIQPGGSLFEQSMLILLDTLFLIMAGETGADQIARRHANLE